MIYFYSITNNEINQDVLKSKEKEKAKITKRLGDLSVDERRIEDTIKNGKIKINKLAQGLPIGGEIEQLDDGTLFSAFKNRVPVTDN